MSHRPPTPQAVTWRGVAVGAAGMAYLAIFYGSVRDRGQSLLLLFVPDEVLLSWVGGDPGRLQVLDRLPMLLVVAWILGTAFFVGYAVLAGLGCARSCTRTEHAVFAMGTGLSVVSIAMLALGLCGVLSQRWLFFTLTGSVWAWAAGRWRRGLSADRKIEGRNMGRIRPLPGASSCPQSSSRVTSEAGTAVSPGEDAAAQASWLARHGLWLAVPLVVLLLLGGMLPPSDFDVCEYHLQVPKEWYLDGRISFLPHNVYGNMPLGAEMHALLAMTLMRGVHAWWWGALAGKTIIAALAPLTALALYAAGQRFISRTAGVVAALVYLSTPWIISVSVSGLIDGAVGFYLLLACYAVARGASETGNWFALAGFLAGSAAACKYPALLFVVLPLAVAVGIFAAMRRAALGAGLPDSVRPVGPGVCGVGDPRTTGVGDPRTTGVGDPRTTGVGSGDPTYGRGASFRLLAFGLAVVCGCGLWLAKNWWFTGNAVYPLVFGGETRTAEKMEQWNRAHRVPRDNVGRRYSGAQAAESLAIIGWRSAGLSPLLLPLAALSLLVRRQRRLVWASLALLAYVVAVWWLCTHRLERFLVPVLPLVAFLAGIGATWSATAVWRRTLTAVVAAGLIANLLVSLSAADHVGCLVSLDELRRGEPAGLSRVHPAHRYLNKLVPEGAAVLLVGDAQPFDLEMPVFYNTCFDDCLFEQWFRDASRDARHRALRERNISHVYVDWNEINRYRRPGNYGFTDYVTPARLRELVDQRILRPIDGVLDRQAGQLGELFEVIR